MGDETGVKSSFKDKFFLVCAGRRTLSISEDPDNLMSGAGSTCPEPRGYMKNLLEPARSVGIECHRISMNFLEISVCSNRKMDFNHLWGFL